MPLTPTYLLATEGVVTTGQIVILALAVACLTFVLLSTRRRIRESRALSIPSAKERYTDLSRSRTAARDLEQVMLELDELSRQIHGRIDTKLAHLEAVLREADERIAKLGGQAVPPGRPIPTHSLGPTPDNAASPPGKPGGARPTERNERVYQMAESGSSTADIARATGIPHGEVDLILALRRTVDASSGTDGTDGVDADAP